MVEWRINGDGIEMQNSPYIVDICEFKRLMSILIVLIYLFVTKVFLVFKEICMGLSVRVCNSFPFVRIK